MSLPEQKRARKALRALVGKLDSASTEEWLGLITEAITNEISIFSYIKAVSIRSALEEASTDTDLNDRILDALTSSGMLPGDIAVEPSDLEKAK